MAPKRRTAPKATADANGRIYTMDQKVAKKLQDNVKEFSFEQLDVLQNSRGLTCRQQVKADLIATEEGRPDAPVWGALYWRQIREVYGEHSDLIDALAPVEPVRAVAAGLKDALTSCWEVPANRFPLVGYLCTVDTVNDTEIAGIYREWVKNWRPRQKSHTEHCTEAIRFMVRIGATSKFEKKLS